MSDESGYVVNLSRSTGQPHDRARMIIIGPSTVKASSVMQKSTMRAATKNGFSSKLCSVGALAILVAIAFGRPAWAWGRLGHRVISRLAEKHMTPQAKTAVAALFEPGESLADASLWAGEHRRELPKTAPWHYVDVPLDEPMYDAKFSGDDLKKGCVVDKINQFRLVIKDQTKTIEERRFALRFLVHCVEDMHMPMHVGDNKDKGGNNTHVRFFDRGNNMHRLSDSEMIERTGNMEELWLADLGQLDTPEAHAAPTKEAAKGRATASLPVVRATHRSVDGACGGARFSGRS